MNLEETKKLLHQVINSKRTQMNDKIRNACFSSYSIISMSFEKWKNDETVNVSKKEIKTVSDSIDMLLSHILNNPLGDDYNNFIKAYCLFVKNWIDNIKKQGDIAGPWNDTLLKIGSVARLADSYFTMSEMLDICRKTIEKMKMMHQRYEPPIELARHYLKSIEDSGVINDPNYCCGKKDSPEKMSDNTSCNIKSVDKEDKKPKVKLGVWSSGEQ